MPCTHGRRLVSALCAEIGSVSFVAGAGIVVQMLTHALAVARNKHPPSL